MAAIPTTSIIMDCPTLHQLSLASDVAWYNGLLPNPSGFVREDGPGVYVKGFRVGGGPAVDGAGLGGGEVCGRIVGFGVGDSEGSGVCTTTGDDVVVVFDSAGPSVGDDITADGLSVGAEISRGGGPEMDGGGGGSVGNGVIGAGVTGATVGRGVGSIVGGVVGRNVGATVGKGVGDKVGGIVGGDVGSGVGATVCTGSVGTASTVGCDTTVGRGVGETVGNCVGCDVGTKVGNGVGANVLGASVGGSTGKVVGAFVVITGVTPDTRNVISVPDAEIS